MTTHILGIDPGLSGCLTLLDKRTQALTAFPVPTIRIKGKTRLDGPTLASWIDVNRNRIAQAYVEVVTSRPRQQGQLDMGVNVGVIHGVLYANCIRFTQVSPAAWKAWFGLKRDDTQTYRDMKTVSRELAAQQWPQQADLFKRVRDDGTAESALIALYGLNLGE